MIYFVQLPTGSIKIGHSDDVQRRLGQLAIHYGRELDLLHTMPGGRSVEAELHEKFKHLRFGRTEQFQPSAELMAFIGQPLLVTANPEDVESADQVDGSLTVRMSRKTISKIIEIQQRQPVRPPFLAVIRWIVTKGIESVEKEAANG